MKKKLLLLCLIFLIKLSIETIYIINVSPSFGYMGFTLNINVYKWIVSSVLIGLIVFQTNANLDFKNLFIHVLILFYYLPITSLYSLKNLSNEYFVFVTICFFILTIFSNYYVDKKFRIRLPISYKMFFIVPITVVTILFLKNGLPSINLINFFNFDELYELRRAGSSVFFLSGYLLPWSTKVIVPFFFTLAFLKKRYGIALLFFIIQMILFSYTGHKSYLFSILFLLFILIIYKARLGLIYLYTSILSLVIFILISIIIKVDIANTLSSLFIRRTFFVPAQNSFYYYDFFSVNDKMLLSHSILEFLIKSPFSDNTANIIGYYYYGSSQAHINTGFLADAYMNFGLLGMISFTVFLILLLYFIELIDTDLRVKIAALFIPMFSFVNGAFLTTILTGGVLIGIIIIILYSKKGCV